MREHTKQPNWAFRREVGPDPGQVTAGSSPVDIQNNTQFFFPQNVSGQWERTHREGMQPPHRTELNPGPRLWGNNANCCTAVLPYGIVDNCLINSAIVGLKNISDLIVSHQEWILTTITNN